MRRGFWVWPLLAVLVAQTVPQGGPPLQTPPPQGPKDGVIQPPQQVDAGMTKPTPPANTYPTPVVKPPVDPKKAK